MGLFLGKDSLLSGKQAQQVYRFVLNIKGIDVALIQNVTSPKYKVQTTPYKMLEYTFHYPKTAEWEGPISFEVLQVIDQDLVTTTLGYFMSKLYDSAYYASPMGIGTGDKDPLLPDDFYQAKNAVSQFFNNGPNTGYVRNATEGTVFDFSKQKLRAALGRVEIKMLDEDGAIYESFRLNGAFITSVKPTDLTYDGEKISTVKIDLSYDWADYGRGGVYAEEDAVSRIFGF